MTIVFLNSTPKYGNQVFLVPNLNIFFYFTNFLTKQIRDADLKYDNIVFKL